MGGSRQNTLKAAFFSGDYSGFVARAIDSPRSAAQPGLEPLAVGALSFVGRIEEAEQLFADSAAAMSAQQRIEARFFLGVGFCRRSQYARARECFAANLRELRRTGYSEPSRFYANQGVGFYRYFCGRFAKALRSARIALRAASQARFPYGKALSYDLVAHCLVQSGEVPAGLEQLRHAVRVAELLGNGGLVTGLLVAQACYEAQFGDRAQPAIERLSALLSRDGFSDTYSKAALLLELGRQYVLVGDLDAAKKALDQACLPIHGAGHRRYGALLSLRYAVVWCERGERHQALSQIRSALAELDPKVDLALELEIRGMEAKLLTELGVKLSASLLERMELLARLTQKGVSQRIRARESRAASGRKTGKDLFADLLDRIALDPNGSLAEVVASGYWGLIKRVIAVPADRVGAELACLPGHVLLFDRGNVRVVAGAASGQIEALIRALARGERTKEELVREVWGYSYHPLRHDPPLYRAIARLRGLLNPDWIESTNSGYRLRQGVVVGFADRQERAARPTAAQAPAAAVQRINYRQVQILRAFEKQEFVDVRSCRRLLGVSEITARRDLSDLVKRGLAARIGNARATKYMKIEEAVR